MGGRDTSIGMPTEPYTTISGEAAMVFGVSFEESLETERFKERPAAEETAVLDSRQ